MRSEDELVALAHASFTAGFTKLAERCEGGATRVAEGLFAFVTGLPFSGFNGCIVTGRVASKEVDEALAWVQERRLPYRLWVADELLSGLGDVSARHGLEARPDPYPGMVLHPVPDAPAPAAGVVILPREDAEPDEVVRVVVESGMQDDLARRVYGALADDVEVQVFVGRLEGRAVGTSTAIQGGGASGVVAVGTLPEARRRGVGTALTWAAVEAGGRRGFDTVVLQSSPTGFPVYSAMGFRTVVAYADFATPRPGRATDGGR